MSTLRVNYALESNLSYEEFADLLRRSSLAERRPMAESVTLRDMVANTELIVTARFDGELIGVSRAISDYAYCTYLSDLAVDRRFQRRGIGKQLIRLTHEAAGLGTNLILLAAPDAANYYPHIGMQAHSSCWAIPRLPQISDSTDGGPHRPDADDCPTATSAQPSTQNLCAESSSVLAKPTNLGQFFDSLAADYDRAIRRCFPRYAEMLWALVDYLPAELSESGRFLDLGCGTGNLSRLLAERFPQASFTCVDLSEASLEACQRQWPSRAALTCIVSDVRRLSFDSHSFDYIVSSIALHHLTSNEKRDLFHSSYQWLKPGGVMAYSDQFSAAEKPIYQRHLQYWQRISRAAGATTDEWETWMEHQRLHDHHDSLGDQMRWLREAGFEPVDCLWRYLLWTVLQARKPASSFSRLSR